MDKKVEPQAEQAQVRAGGKRKSREQRVAERIQRAAENGSVVLQTSSGDDVSAIIYMIPQLDRAITRMHQRTRSFNPEIAAGFENRLSALVDEMNMLSKDACEYAGFDYKVPFMLLQKPTDENLLNSQKRS